MEKANKLTGNAKKNAKKKARRGLKRGMSSTAKTAEVAKASAEDPVEVFNPLLRARKLASVGEETKEMATEAVATEAVALEGIVS